MSPRKRAKAAPPRPLRVGDRVSFELVGRRVDGVIVEDRGPLGKGGVRIFGVRARLASEIESVVELPADELSVSPKAA